MYLADVSLALGLTIANMIIGVLISTSRVPVSASPLLLPLATAVCGFLVSRSKKLLVIIAETSCLLTIVLMRRLYILTPLTVAYVFGVVAGLVKRRGGLELDFRRPTSLYPVVVSLGFSMLGAGVLGVIEAPLATPISALIREGPTIELLISTTIAYSIQVYVASMIIDVNFVSIALASFLAPYTLPLLSTLPSLSHTQLQLPRAPYLKLGNLVEVIRGEAIRELAFPFKKGLNRNIVVVGATGTGKSTLAKNMLLQLKRLGVPVVVFDVHGEYCAEFSEYNCVDASDISIDIFKVYEEDSKSRAEFVADAISDVYSLGNLQRIALAKTLLQIYGGSYGEVGFDYLLEYLWKASRGEIDLGVPASVARSLIPYIEKLRNTFKSGGRKVEEIIDSVTVIDFSKLSSEVSTIIAEIVAEELYHIFKDLNRELVLVIEEAHRFLRKGRSVSRIFREGRKYGISAILITQDVSGVPREILLNTAALVSFSTPELATARYIAKIVTSDDQALYEKVLSKLVSLPRFQALAFVSGMGSYIIEIRPPIDLLTTT